jgi:hypothetical protein
MSHFHSIFQYVLFGAGGILGILSLSSLLGDHPEITNFRSGWIKFIIVPGVVGALMVLAAFWW